MTFLLMSLFLIAISFSFLFLGSKVLFTKKQILIAVGFVCLAGQAIVAQQADTVSLYEITVGGKSGFIDQTGKVVIEPKFDGVDDFSEGLTKSYMVGKYSTGYIDKTGEIVIQPQFDIGSNFSEGFAWVGFDPEKTTF